MPVDKERHFWLVTFVTHNARVSDRMREFKVNTGPCVVFDAEMQLRIAGLLAESWRRYNIQVFACNVLPDHVHIILAAENEQQLNEHVRKMKGYASHALRDVAQKHIWQQKFNRKHLADEHAFYSARTYVLNNHLKHVERWAEEMLGMGKGVQLLAASNSYLDEDKGLKPLASSAANVREQIQTALARGYISIEDLGRSSEEIA
jgi:REP element-mobilizing transposase RayT